MRVVVVVAFLLAAVAAQAPASAAGYGALASLDVADMLPPPPGDGSSAQRGELAELHHIAAQRTAAAVAAAQADSTRRNVFLFAPIFGPRFDARHLPKTAALSAALEATEMAGIRPAKRAFARRRPYQFDATLHPVCHASKKPNSYPSAHVVSVYLEALVLASIVPEKKAAIFSRAAAYAHERLVCGVHYPSDITAGKLLGYALFGIVSDDPRFQAARRAAAAELHRVLDLETAAQ